MTACVTVSGSRTSASHNQCMGSIPLQTAQAIFFLAGVVHSMCGHQAFKIRTRTALPSGALQFLLGKLGKVHAMHSHATRVVPSYA